MLLLLLDDRYKYYHAQLSTALYIQHIRESIQIYQEQEERKAAKVDAVSI